MVSRGHRQGSHLYGTGQAFLQAEDPHTFRPGRLLHRRNTDLSNQTHARSFRSRITKPLLKVTTRRKVMRSSSAQSGTAPTRVALRAPMLSKPGWEREEVKRQTGITKGKWDVYFYAPGRRAPLRSRPELKEYCEQELRVKFNADDFDWVLSQEKPGYLTSDDDEAQERPRYEEGGESSGTNVWVPLLGMCKDSELETEFPYRSLVGSLMFLASRTRPDILYSTIYLSEFNNHHSIKHIKCLLQILQPLEVQGADRDTQTDTESEAPSGTSKGTSKKKEKKLEVEDAPPLKSSW
uniref:MBD domain-containing protein n=1 Tax=Strigamia maritima TaxID=126957 RepID=T1IK15_STRMM